MSTPVERDRSLDRYLTFLDAIVAIAITLLVLPLVDLASNHEGSTRELLGDHLGEMGAFALSFFVIFRFWWGQHRIVRDVVADDPMTNRALFAWVATIVFLPFPSALVATNSDEAATRALYIGTMSASAAALTVVAWAAARNERITAGRPGPDVGSAATLTLVMVVAFVLSVAFSSLSYYPLLLLFLTGPVRTLLGRWLPWGPFRPSS